jgi:orotidine-5'-phosphate decarboxylase
VFTQTHIDILSSFPESLPTDLQDLAKEHNFLLFEDRKFADIGNTVSLQYQAGIYRIVEWADIVTVHAVPGPGVVSGLKSVTNGRVRGGLMLAEMSSNGNLCTPEYQSSAVKIAQDNEDFILGFIAMKPVADGFLTLTPGVQMASKGDSLGQVYRDPKDVIRQGSDIIIVGRGITGAEDIESAAILYREEGWKGYLGRL